MVTLRAKILVFFISLLTAMALGQFLTMNPAAAMQPQWVQMVGGQPQMLGQQSFNPYIHQPSGLSWPLWHTNNLMSAISNRGRSNLYGGLGAPVGPSAIANERDADMILHLMGR